MAKAKGGGLIAPQESKDEFTFNQRVEVDGITTEMQCKLTHFKVKNRIVIVHQITTKQLSFDPKDEEMVLMLAALQIKSAYKKGLEVKREFLENESNYDQTQGELPFNNGDDDGAFINIGLPGSAETD